MTPLCPASLRGRRRVNPFRRFPNLQRGGAVPENQHGVDNQSDRFRIFRIQSSQNVQDNELLSLEIYFAA